MARQHRAGFREDIGIAVRSSWEHNVALWLNYTGIKWLYEPTTFWFTPIKRGTRSYTPDFYLPAEDRYIEVKGWMDQPSRTKLARMAKYYPDIKIELIDATRYRGLARTYGAVIPGWEHPRDGRTAKTALDFDQSRRPPSVRHRRSDESTAVTCAAGTIDGVPASRKQIGALIAKAKRLGVRRT